MASLEIWTDTKVTVFEEPDEGGGVELTVTQVTNDYGHPETACTFNGDAVSKWWLPTSGLVGGMALIDAFEALGRLEGWVEVKLNGQTIWSAEALEAVQEAIEG